MTKTIKAIITTNIINSIQGSTMNVGNIEELNCSISWARKVINSMGYKCSIDMLSGDVFAIVA